MRSTAGKWGAGEAEVRAAGRGPGRGAGARDRGPALPADARQGGAQRRGLRGRALARPARAPPPPTPAPCSGESGLPQSPPTWSSRGSAHPGPGWVPPRGAPHPSPFHPGLLGRTLEATIRLIRTPVRVLNYFALGASGKHLCRAKSISNRANRNLINEHDFFSQDRKKKITCITIPSLCLTAPVICGCLQLPVEGRLTRLSHGVFCFIFLLQS